MDRTARTPCQAWRERRIVLWCRRGAWKVSPELTQRRGIGRQSAALKKSLHVCRRAGQQAALPKPFERLHQFLGVRLRNCVGAPCRPLPRRRSEPGFPQPSSGRSASPTRPPRPCRAAHRPLPTRTRRRAPRRPADTFDLLVQFLLLARRNQLLLLQLRHRGHEIGRDIVGKNRVRSSRHPSAEARAPWPGTPPPEAARQACARDAAGGAGTSRRARPAATRPRPGRWSRAASATCPDRRSASQRSRPLRRAGRPASRNR